MSAHTPGPWHAGIGNGEGSIFSDSGRTRLEDGGTTLYPICSYNRGWNADEDAANARLVAAAPDLLEALRATLRCLEWHEQRHGVGMDAKAVKDAYAAIAKAIGEAV